MKPDQPRELHHLPTWQELNQDTAPEIDVMLLEHWRTVPAWRKLQAISALNRSVLFLTYQQMQAKHPDASEEELRYYLIDHLYGSEMAQGVYPTSWSKQGSKQAVALTND
ncbi:MAG: hypothetical protein KJ063_04715 [Anaerolineae bacterium]|nr:hypothetical protein [Anaerolineae bacterium]